MTYISISEAFKILNLPNTASDIDIQKRWRIVAKKYHPDLHPNDPNAKKKFKKCRDAYEVLNTFKVGSRTVSALEEDALDGEFDYWLENLGISKEHREQIQTELDDILSEE